MVLGPCYSLLEAIFVGGIEILGFWGLIPADIDVFKDQISPNLVVTNNLF